MIEDYEDFDLYLEWYDDKSISVRNNPDASPARSFPVDPEDFTPLGDMKLANLVTEGLKIAEILLPEGEIRGRFNTLRGDGKKIRLRLIYPHPRFDGNQDARQQQIKGLAKIRWEYIFMPPEGGEDIPGYDYLLGLRDDISIVHNIRPVNTPGFCNQKVLKHLPLKVRYISWFGADSGSLEITESIFEEFNQEIKKVGSIINYVGDIDKPDSFDAELALQHDHIVHLTGHGNLNLIEVDPEDPLTIPELLKPFQLASDTEVRVVIFLSCGSNNGDGGLAAALHRHAKIPVVVGMTGTVLPSPTAENFVKGFYKGLTRKIHGNIEHAVVLGRRSMFNQGTIQISALNRLDAGSTEWDAGFGLPRLYMSCWDSVILSTRALFGDLEQFDVFDAYIDTLIREAHEESLDLNYQTKLQKWVADNLSRWLIVFGKPGSGKSTHIAHFIKKQEGLIYHFCIEERPETLDPLFFIRDSLIPQLSQYIGTEEYFKLCPPGKYPLYTNNATDALIDFIYIPLLKAKENDKDFRVPVIVIDGCDVMPLGFGEYNTVLGLLRKHHDILDNVVRFILTIEDRSDTPGSDFQGLITDVLDQITYDADTLTIDSTNELSINAENEDIDELVKGTILEGIVSKEISTKTPLPLFTKIVKRFRKHLITEIVSKEISTKTPLPLFTKIVKKFRKHLITENAHDTPDTIEAPQLDPDDWASPVGLEKLYDYLFKVVVVRHPCFEKVRLFLDLAASSYVALSPIEIATIAGIDRAQLDSIWPEIKIFFADRNQESGLFYYHNTLRQYILRAIYHRHQQVAIHQFFVDAFRPISLEWYDEGVDFTNLKNTKWYRQATTDSAATGSNGTQSLPKTRIPQYARRFLAQHAYQSYRGTDWKDKYERLKYANDFLKLICAPGFRNMRRSEVLRDHIETDIRNALRVLHTELIYRYKDLDLIKNVDQVIAANEFDIQHIDQQLIEGKTNSHGERLALLFSLLGVEVAFSFL